MIETDFMRLAVALSRQGMRSGAGGPFGALIVRGGNVIGEGWNRVTSSNDPTAHAEIVAIREACKNTQTFNLEGAEIYTSCEPCPMCLSAIHWARIGKIYYANTRKDAARISFDDDFLYQEIPKDVKDRKIPMIRRIDAEALAVFEEWRLKEDKISY
jgi:tRNA(Arg) A34 adenosine deaminase TadA